jgi:potassium efflux system protein
MQGGADREMVASSAPGKGGRGLRATCTKRSSSGANTITYRPLCILAILAFAALWLIAPTWHPATAAESGEPAAAAQQPAQAIQPPSLAPAPAPSLVFPDELAQRVARLAAEIDSAEKAVERVKDRESGLAEQRVVAERLAAEAQNVIGALGPRLLDLRAQFEKLGPPPDKADAPEAPAVAAERARLGALLSQMEGAVKTAELTRVRSRQLIGRVQELRQQIFARDLLRRSSSIVSTYTWRQLGDELPRAGRQIAGLADSWWEQARAELATLFILLLAAAAIFFTLRTFAAAAIRRNATSAREAPGLRTRAKRAALTAASLAVPRAAAAVALYAGLGSLDLLTMTVGRFADAGLHAYLAYVAIFSLANALIAPCPAEARVLDLEEGTARALVRLATAFAVVLALDLLMREVAAMLYLPLEIGVVQTSLANLAYAGLMLGLVRMPLPVTSSASLSLCRWLKLPVATLAIAIIASTLLGYVALGSFISTQTLLIGAASLGFLLVHIFVRALIDEMTSQNQAVGRVLEARLGLDRERSGYLSRLLVFLFDLVLIAAIVPLVLLTWGYSANDILDWVKLGIFGFEIGQFRISLARIFIAVLLFLGLVSGTRLVQRWLDRSVLQPARVDRAISHSVLMGIGYAGIALAALAALSYAGLDFTQLAIVAGALSLGIGFGLQAIFNNFVSGIILLIERPIKVGDWIIVNGQEGFVRRINVRATEIETFDRASLIVPNSQLITGTVTNWTHRNPMGRLIIRIGVSYKSDPEEVLRILTRVAEDSQSILKQPAPTAVFENFGDSALEFSLRAFVPDVTQGLAVQTELRLAICKAFRAAGIEIPYPQHDIHLRDLDGVRQALSAAMEARQRERELETAPAR